MSDRNSQTSSVSELAPDIKSRARSAPVSVVIPAYNGERFIRAAIESVQAQTLAVAEIIVVDDGSRDCTIEIAKDLGVNIIRQLNKGVSAARNSGIRAAANSWIAFIDQDDLWRPEKIEYQWGAIESYPDAAVVSCHMSWFADDSIRAHTPEIDADGGFGKENDGRITYFFEVSQHLPLNRMIDYTSSFLVRRDVLTAAGMFNEELGQNEDLECFLRVVARSPLAIVRRSLVWHRVHDRNTSLLDPEGAASSYEKILDWLRAFPDKYPKGAGRTYDLVFSRHLTSAGRALLDTGQRREARSLFRSSLKKAFSVRTLLLWCLSFLTPTMFHFAHSTKRAVLGNLRQPSNQKSDSSRQREI